MVKTQFQLFKVQRFASALAVVLFFGADRAGQSIICFWLQICSVSLLVQKQIYSLKRRFLWCGKFHVVSVTLLKVRTVRLAFQRLFLVLSVRFLRRCLFQVVSLTSRFETTPDLSASKHIKFVVLQSLVRLKIVARCLATNKLLKRDSQRVAFLLCVEFSD